MKLESEDQLDRVSDDVTTLLLRTHMQNEFTRLIILITMQSEDGDCRIQLRKQLESDGIVRSYVCKHPWTN